MTKTKETNMTIKQIRVRDNWVEGDYKGYYFQAKLFVFPSDYGINSGRVSKLYVLDKQEHTVLNYDRGWDIGEDLIKTTLAPLLVKLEKFAQKPAFANQFPSEGL